MEECPKGSQSGQTTNMRNETITLRTGQKICIRENKSTRKITILGIRGNKSTRILIRAKVNPREH